MRRLKEVALGTPRLGVLLLAAATAIAEDNLFSNPGFETPWKDWKRDVGGGKAQPQGTFKWDDAVKQSGQYSAMIAKQAQDGLVARWFRYVAVEEGREYRVSVFYRTDEDFSGRADIMAHGSGINEKSSWLQVPSTEWERASLRFTPTESGDIAIYMQNRGTGTIWFDDISLEELAPQEMVNLIRNAGCEQAQPNGIPADGWWVYPGNLADVSRDTARVFVDSTVAHTGSASVKCHIRGKQNLSLVSPRHCVNPGDTLQISFFYKSNLNPLSLSAEERKKQERLEHPRTKSEPVIFALTYRNAIGHSHEPQRMYGKLSTDGWEKMEGTFAVPKGAVHTEAQLTLVEAVGEIWWDTLTVRKRNAYSMNLSPYEEKCSQGKNRLKLVLENYTRSKDGLRLTLSLDDEPAATKAITPKGSPQETVAIDYELGEPGKYKLRLSLSSEKDGQALFVGEKDVIVSGKLTTSVPRPAYVWPEQNINTVSERILVDLPDAIAGESALVVEVRKDGRLLKRDRLVPVRPETKYAFPVGGLEPGEYQMRIALLDKADGVMVYKEEAFRIMGRPRPRIGVKGGKLIIEGEPVFPIGMFSPWPKYYREYAEAGFNFVHSYDFEGNASTVPAKSVRSCMALMDRAWDVGLWCLVNTPAMEVVKRDWHTVRERLLTFRDHPSVVAYMEEEEMARGFHTPESLKEWYNLIREVDPARPILLGDTRRITKEGQPRRFVLELMDMGVWWWYPFPLAEGHTEVVVPDWLVENVRLTDKPIWVAPQSYKGQRVEKRYPLPEEYRIQAYLAIIHGADGLMYFGGHIFYDPEGGHWDELKQLVRELRDMSPVFLSPTSDLKVEMTGGEKISTLLKEHGESHVLIAANRDRSTAKATFRLPFDAGRITRRRPAGIGANHPIVEITPKDNSFQDTLDRYAVHIYEVESHIE